MNNWFTHRSHPRTHGGSNRTTATIDDKEPKTVTCGVWPWKIPKFHIAPAVRSMYFRLRGRTPVKSFNEEVMSSPEIAADRHAIRNGQRSAFRRNKVEPLRNVMFSASASNPSVCTPSSTTSCPRSSSRSSTGGDQEAGVYNSFCLPGAVEDLGANTAVQSTSATHPMSGGLPSVGCLPREAVPTTPFFHGPKYFCQSSCSDHGMDRQIRKEDQNDVAISAVSAANVSEGNDRDVTEKNSTSNLSGRMASSIDVKDEETPIETDFPRVIGEKKGGELSCEDHQVTSVFQTPRSPEPEAGINQEESQSVTSPLSNEQRSPDDRDVPAVQSYDNEVASQSQPSIACSSDSEVDCCGNEKPSFDQTSLRPESGGINKKVNCWVDIRDCDVSESSADESDLDEELDFYENHDMADEGEDDLDMDKVLGKCPESEVRQNLTDMIQLSKSMTSQLERALRRTARISCGPFPRLPGSGLTKSQIIDSKCRKLAGETEEFLGSLNKNFLTFYTVLDQMDQVAIEQDRYASSIFVRKGPRDWRRTHAIIVRRMEKMWTKHFDKVITRKVRGRIKEAIPEVEED